MTVRGRGRRAHAARTWSVRQSRSGTQGTRCVNPSTGSKGERVDDVAEHASCPPETLSRRARARIGGLLGDVARRLPTDASDVPVPVEDVVDDLEEEAELRPERAPRALIRVRHAGGPQPEPDRGLEAALPVFRRWSISRSASSPVMSRYCPPIMPKRRVDELARDPRIVVREREPKRLGEERVPGEQRDALAERDVRARASAPLGVVVHGREVVVDERERVHELERDCGRKRVLELAACRLGDREAEHRPDALSARLERVAKRLLEAAELGSRR